MRQTELHLNEEDRVALDEIRSKGVHHSREVNRAHTLSCLDRNIPESQIMDVLGIGRTAVWRTRSAYLQGGIELAVFDVARAGHPEPAIRHGCPGTVLAHLCAERDDLAHRIKQQVDVGGVMHIGFNHKGIAPPTQRSTSFFLGSSGESVGIF